MGRGKVQLKRIEDKSSRQVTFSKRKNGLMKKARELAVLCDVDLGLLIFSPKGKLYQFTSGESLTNIVDRYQLHLAEEAAVCNSAKEAKQQNSLEEFKDFWRENSLQEIIGRQIEDQNIEQLNLTQLIHLEKQLESILRQTRHRKTQIMLDAVAALHEKEKQLRQEKEVIQEEIAAAAASRPMIVQVEDDDDGGEGFEGLNHHKGLLHFF